MSQRMAFTALFALAAIPVCAAPKTASPDLGHSASPDLGHSASPRVSRPGSSGRQLTPASLPAGPQTLARAARIAARIPDVQFRALFLALVAAQQRRTGDARSAAITFQQARKAALIITPSGARESRLEDVAELQAQAGDVASAFHTIGLIHNELYHDSALFKIARSQAEAGHLEEARRTAARQRLYETEATAEALALAYAKTGKVPEALALAQPLEADDQAGVFTAVALAQLRAGDRVAATEMFQRALERAAAANTPLFRDQRLAELAAALAQSGQHDEALGAAARIPAAGKRNLAVVNLAVIYARAGAFARARAVLEKISTGVSRAHALALIAQEEEKAGNHSGAVATLDQARQAMGTTRVAETRVQVDVIGNQAYYELARAQITVGDVAGARESGKALRSEELRASLLKELAEYLCRTGDKKGGAAAFREARQAAVRVYKSPYDRERGALLSGIITAQCRMGDRSGAWTACVELQDPVDQVSALLGFADTGAATPR